MADFKLTIADPKTGKCVQREAQDATSLLGKKIGDKIEGSSIGLEGYELELTGGSDKGGFPMRWDVQGTGRKKILAISGVGLKKKAKGIKQRKTVCGNTIHENIVQVNLKVIKAGKEELFAAKKADGEAPAEEKKEEAKSEPAKEESKPEEKKEEIKEAENKEGENKEGESKEAESKEAEKPAEEKEEAPKEEKEK
jgi:small subunit ribosomal protein S6e